MKQQLKRKSPRRESLLNKRRKTSAQKIRDYFKGEKWQSLIEQHVKNWKQLFKK